MPFLNLMALLAERAGSVHVRVGGNTQESAALVPSLPNGKILEKQAVNVNDPVRGQKIAMLGMLDQHAPRTRRRRPHTYYTPQISYTFSRTYLRSWTSSGILVFP